MKQQLTMIEIQIQIAALQRMLDRAKLEGHDIIARECRKVITTYKRRIKRTER